MAEAEKQGFMISDIPKQGCSEELPDKLFWIDQEDKVLETPMNIVGYFLRMTQKYLQDSETYSKVQVNPSINDEYFETFGDPLVTIKRGLLQPSNLPMPGFKEPLTKEMPEAIPGLEEKFPEANILESNQYKDLIHMQIQANVYASTLAECESIGNLLHQLYFANSYDVLRVPFPFIQNVEPPIMTETNVMDKHDDVYFLTIQWGLSYWDESILLIKKNVIKYATIIVRDEPIENVIYRAELNKGK
jgi:hypothetical protein